MMSNGGEPIVVCPYNKAHSIIRSRMQFHLTKCRSQHPNSEKVICPYNSTHVIAKVELEYHQEICSNRIVVDSFFYDVGRTKCPVKNAPFEIPPDDQIPCEENWDDEPSVSVLSNLKENAKERDVLLNLIGATKAEKKAHRVQERLRYQRIIDAKEAEKKAIVGGAPACESTSHSLTMGKQSHCDTFSAESMLQEPSAASSSNYDKEGQFSNADDDNKFEVVKYNKKCPGKKQNQKTMKLQDVLQPTQNRHLSTEDELLSQVACLKLDQNASGQTNQFSSVSSGAIMKRNKEIIRLAGNAWDKPLNMGVKTNNNIIGNTDNKFNDFPSLPVSGRGKYMPKKV